MNLESECRLSGPLLFILRISRVFGIAPLNFERECDGWRTHVSKLYHIYGQIVVTSYVVLSIVVPFQIMEDDSYTPNYAYRRRIVWILDIVSLGLASLAIGYTGFSRMSCITHCIAKISQINQKLNGSSLSSHPTNTNAKLIVVLATMLTCVTITLDFTIFMCDMFALKVNVIKASFYVFNAVCFFNLTLYVQQFTHSVLYVLSSMCQLNDHLRDLPQLINNNTTDFLITKSVMTSMLTKKDGCIRLTGRTHLHIRDFAGRADEKHTASTIHQLGRLYCSLTDIIDMLNDSNGLPLVVLFVCILLHLVVTGYHLVGGIILSKQSSFLTTLQQSLWIIFHFAHLLMIIEPCHRTLKEMDLTKDQITKKKKSTPSKNYATMYELKLFYHHLILNETSYSPLDLFKIDRSIIVAIMGSITTYIIVIIQI